LILIGHLAIRLLYENILSSNRTLSNSSTNIVGVLLATRVYVPNFWWQCATPAIAEKRTTAEIAQCMARPPRFLCL